jgi:hypothetical protein
MRGVFEDCGRVSDSTFLFFLGGDFTSEEIRMRYMNEHDNVFNAIFMIYTSIQLAFCSVFGNTRNAHSTPPITSVLASFAFFNFPHRLFSLLAPPFTLMRSKFFRPVFLLPLLLFLALLAYLRLVRLFAAQRVAGQVRSPDFLDLLGCGGRG